MHEFTRFIFLSALSFCHAGGAFPAIFGLEEVTNHEAGISHPNAVHRSRRRGIGCTYAKERSEGPESPVGYREHAGPAVRARSADLPSQSRSQRELVTCIDGGTRQGKNLFLFC